MKRTKKFFSLVLIVVVCFSVLTTVASAAYSHTRHVNDADRFEDNEWEHTRHYVSDGEYIGRLVYGYDTDYLNEDYAWAYGADCVATAGIMRVGVDTSYISGVPAAKNNYSKLQIDNKSTDVYYKITLSTTYTNVTSYLDSDTNENV